MRARTPLVACLCFVLFLLAAPGAQASFGIKSLNVKAESEDGSIDTQAGSHPYAYTVSFDLNLHEDAEETPEGILSGLEVDLPPGLLGNPLATPRCTGAQFEGQTTNCPTDSQIGVVHIREAQLGLITNPVYNLVPGLGVPASIGFSLAGKNSFQEASIRSESDFGATVSDITLPTNNIKIQSVSETIWGEPADHGHDPERGLCIIGSLPECEEAYGGTPKPFLTLPTACNEPLQSTVRVESLEEPGVVQSKSAFSLDQAEEPVGLDGCNALEFEPSISSQPTTNLADSPTGLDFDLHQPQNEEVEGLATAALKDVTVTLPEGMSLNPSAANGLEACSESQIGFLAGKEGIHFSEEPQSCPDASKVGTVDVSTPPVDHKLLGSVYVAKPFDNPFGSLLAIYLAIEDEQTGVIAKLAGKVEPDSKTGQLKTTFTESPQLPLEDVEVHIFEGARAALKTPLACGEYTTTTSMTPWSTPEGVDAHPSDSFATSLAAGGSGPCPGNEAGAPNKPGFSAGTIAPQAAAFSPFVLRLARPDGSQRLSGIDATLPPGLTGKLAGIPYCPEAAIAQAKGREAPNQGVVEQQSPSCPAASEVGSVTVGAGAGVSPFYAQGHAYLAGPYKGAPLSLVFITPAVAGPFDLGAVVVRAALNVDPETARIHAVSDPLPSIIDGIPLDLRSISLKLDRPSFTLNPTSCDPMSITGSSLALTGQGAALTSPFQVGGCQALKFKPNLSLKLKGGTKRGDHPALTATLRAKPGEANTADVAVSLPRSEFLDQAHIKTICTRVQFSAGAHPGDGCPKGSIYGQATAITPLLDHSLSGPVFLRSSSHNLPDLVIALHGQVDIVVDGRIDSHKGGIRNSIEAAPDAPVTRFTLSMQGGKKGLLVNSRDICRSRARASVQMTGQNGKPHDFAPVVRNKKCRGAGSGRRGSAAR